MAVSEAHDSGLCAAGSEVRRSFASDLLNLTLAAPEVNRCMSAGKCAYDAAGWLPSMNKCWFAARVIAVRRKYALTVDHREVEALKHVLSACTSTGMIDTTALLLCPAITRPIHSCAMGTATVWFANRCSF